MGIDASDIRVFSGAVTEGRSGEVELSAEQQREDAHRTLETATDFRPDAILLDSYLLGAVWHSVVRSHGIRLAVFDDLADRPIDADIVVNAAGLPADYSRLAPGATALCGLEYAVTSAPPAPPPRFDRPGAMLIAFGASDADDATSRVLVALAALRPHTDSFDAWIQLGAGAPHRHAVQRLAKTLGWAHLLGPSEPIDAAGRGIALSIGAAGVSLFERMRDGIPGVLLPLAPNQIRIAKAAASRGAAVITSTPEMSASIAIALLGSPARLQEMCTAGQAAVDGMGARRVGDTISACCR